MRNINGINISVGSGKSFIQRFNLEGESDEERERILREEQPTPTVPTPIPILSDPDVDIGPGWTELPSSPELPTTQGEATKTPLPPSNGPYIWKYKIMP